MDLVELDASVAATTRNLTQEAINSGIDFEFVGPRRTALEEIMLVQVQNLLITHELLQKET